MTAFTYYFFPKEKTTHALMIVRCDRQENDAAFSRLSASETTNQTPLCPAMPRHSRLTGVS